MKTRSVDKYKYRNYLKKAKEFYDTMNDSMAKNNFNSAVLNAVHCSISSSDALTVFYKGIRHSGERHEDVVSVLNTLGIEEMPKKNRQLLGLLKIKNSAEYEEKLMTEKDAFGAVKNAEKFFLWVNELLKE